MINDTDNINLLYFCLKENIRIKESFFGSKNKKVYFVVIQTGERFLVDRVEGPRKVLKDIAAYAKRIGLKRPQVKVEYE
jgi:hypothetical protein